MSCEFIDTRYGWTLTRISTIKANEYYKSVMDILKKLPLGTDNSSKPKLKGNKLPPSGHIRLSCNCNRVISTTPSSYSKGGIYCICCQSFFITGKDKILDRIDYDI